MTAAPKTADPPQDPVAIVTAASRAIGAASARALPLAGATAVLKGRTETELGPGRRRPRASTWFGAVHGLNALIVVGATVARRTQTSHRPVNHASSEPHDLYARNGSVPHRP